MRVAVSMVMGLPLFHQVSQKFGSDDMAITAQAKLQNIKEMVLGVRT